MKEYKGREGENRTLVLNHGVDDTKHTHTHTHACPDGRSFIKKPTNTGETMDMFVGPAEMLAVAVAAAVPASLRLLRGAANVIFLLKTHIREIERKKEREREREREKRARVGPGIFRLN